MKLVYKIDSTNDREGNLKSIPTSWSEPEYFIYVAHVGRSAILIDNDDENMTIRTSTIEDITIWENGIKLTTRNTVYYLKPVIKGEWWYEIF